MNEGPSIIPGTWHSVREPETGDTAHVLADERDVTLSLSGSTARVRSLPGSASRLEMDLDLSRRPGIAGNWAQRDDPDSPVLIGNALFILAGDGQSMTGKCMGGDPSLPHVNMGTWTLTLAERHPDDPDRPAEQELGHSIPMNFPIPDTACPIPDANPDATIPPDRGSWRSTITQATITAQSSAARRAAPLPLPLTA